MQQCISQQFPPQTPAVCSVARVPLHDMLLAGRVTWRSAFLQFPPLVILAVPSTGNIGTEIVVPAWYTSIWFQMQDRLDDNRRLLKRCWGLEE